MAGASAHIASQFRQAGPTNANSPFHEQHDDAQSTETIFDTWQQLEHHQQYTEFNSQIAWCLKADEDVWYCLCLLRLDPRAHGLVYSITPSIFLTPPHELWTLLVRLRSSQDWEANRNVILAQLNHQPSHTARGYPSARASNVSDHRSAHLSVISAQSSRFSSASSNSALSYVQVDPDSPMRPRLHTAINAENKPLPLEPSIQPQAIKEPRKAPKGKWWTCPYPQCKGKDGFKRRGAYDNHMAIKHSITASQDTQPHHHTDQRVEAMSTPVKDEKGEEGETSQGSSESYPEKKALSVGTPVPKDQDYHHLNPFHLSSDLRPPANYWGTTGVHNMQTDHQGSMGYFDPNTFGRQDHSSFDFDSPMSQN